ncbi:ADOP family duplicated permease [Luteimonas sp. FCS-9]|uniref:ADOP family duplicated permease n=1 Tax=Luteimonas sp. FCS-9 TaxID=1547516 RepID=UPI00063E9BC9|nr:ADOP family duplicated permease [Luteimonas sp. FCS-9]KLJ02969.1 hypothetical protein WQ56_01540 [Luteimonas sp. FCS-9]
MTPGVAWREAGQAWRGLLRRPGYLMLAMLTLALGVATTTAVFALIDQALLRPLPFPESARLVTIGQYDDGDRNVAGPAYREPVRAMGSVVSVGMLRGWTMDANIARGDTAEVVRSMRADRGFIDTLGLPPMLGRNFSVEEDRPHGPQAVILAHAHWRQAYGADPAAVGRVVQLEGQAAEIVGVLPASFQWPEPFDVLLPLQQDTAARSMSTNEILVARLAPGVDIAAASAEAATVIGQLMLDDGTADRRDALRQHLREHPPSALPMLSSLFRAQSGNTLWLFSAAAGCVLLIAAVNLASLMLLRTLDRSHDHAVRLALGASLPRLGLPMLAEGALIGITGAAIGLLLAWLGLRLFAGAVPLVWLRGEPPALSVASLVFAAACGVGTAVFAALLGIWRTRRLPLAAELVGGGRGGWSRSSGHLGKALVVTQVALAVVLLIGAGLFMRTLQELSNVPLGIESRQTYVFNLSPVKGRVETVEAVDRQTTRILERLRRMPGVAAAAAASNPPVTTQLNFSVELPDRREISSQYRFMTPDMFAVFGIPVLAGRGLTAGDVAGAESVCVVSEAFARRYLDGDALGKLLTMPFYDGPQSRAMRVVGVVGDVRHAGPAEPAAPVMYTPMAQLPDAIWQIIRGFGGLTYSMRMHGGTAVDEAALQRAIAEVAPGQPISNLRAMTTVVASTTGQQALNLQLVGLFAALALLLASVGLYAVMATSVAARRHEFGVRAALGAPPARLLRQVLLESARQIGMGLAIGLTLALSGSRVLQGFLFGVEPADPLAVGLVLGVLALTAVAAAWVPAVRAARVSPMQALRT